MSRKDKETAKKTTGTKKKSRRQQTSWLFNITAILVVIALVSLAVSILSPNLFDRLFRSSPLQRGDVVMTIGDYAVSTEQYLYVALQYKLNYQSAYGDNVFEKDPTLEKEVLAQVENALISRACLLVYADQLGIELTADGEAAAADKVQLMKDQYGDDYPQQFARVGLSEELLYKLECENWIMSQLQEMMYDPEGPFIQGVTDADRAALIDELQLLSAEHILITGSENASENARKLTLAQNLVRRLRAGEDFETLAHQYSEDEHSHDPLDKMFTVTGATRPSEYIAAVTAMEIGDVSDVVVVDYGDGSAPDYYVIVRTAPDAGLVTEVIVEQQVEEELSEVLDTTDIQYARGYKYIRMSQIISPYADEAVDTDDETSDVAEDILDETTGDPLDDITDDGVGDAGEDGAEDGTGNAAA